MTPQAKKNPYEELASVLQSSSSSQAARQWFDHFSSQLTHWPLATEQLETLWIPEPASVQPPVEPAQPPQVPAARPLARPKNAQSAYFQVILNGASNDLREARAETRRRAERAFSTALGLGMLGGIAFFVGLGLVFSGMVAVGATSGIGGGVSGIFSGVFARLYTTENGDLRRMMADLRRIEEARLGLWLADHIADADRRDEAIHGLIEQIRLTSASPPDSTRSVSG